LDSLVGRFAAGAIGAFITALGIPLVRGDPPAVLQGDAVAFADGGPRSRNRKSKSVDVAGRRRFLRESDLLE
jgi:hypothetical protein